MPGYDFGGQDDSISRSDFPPSKPGIKIRGIYMFSEKDRGHAGYNNDEKNYGMYMVVGVDIKMDIKVIRDENGGKSDKEVPAPFSHPVYPHRNDWEKTENDPIAPDQMVNDSVVSDQRQSVEISRQYQVPHRLKQIYDGNDDNG